MKKLLPYLLILIACQFTYSQDYKKFWQEVEGHELEGKPKSALEVVDKIYRKSKRQKNTSQIIKCFLYHSKFINTTKEDSQDLIITDISSLIEESKFPTTAILESVYAQILEQYLNKNQYTIRNRSKTDSSTSSTDYKTWGIDKLTQEIEKHYRNSLQDEERLKNIPIGDFEVILTSGDKSEQYRPTLFDFLAHRAISFYSDEKYYVTRPKDEFIINDPVALGATADFVKEDFYTTDSVFSKRNALKLYQKLENFHLSKTNHLAYVDVLLKRLNFVKENGVFENKELIYDNRLKSLSNQFKGKEASSIINYQIAKDLYDTTTGDNSPKFNSKRKKALEICDKVIQDFPKSEGAHYCKTLKEKIENPFFNFKTEKYTIPNKPILAQVKFKNIDSVHVFAYKIPAKILPKGNYYWNRSTFDSIVKRKIRSAAPIKHKKFKLPNKNDYYQYSTEIVLPKFESGHYILIAGKNEAPKAFEDVLGYGAIAVSNMSVLSTNYDDYLSLKVLDRFTGNPIKKANVVVSEDFKTYKTGKTNSDGTFILKRPKKEYYDLEYTISSANDTVFKDFSLYQKNEYEDDGEDDWWEAKPYIYLDRSIYRPGQTIYFKGILIEQKNGVSSVVPNVYVSVIAYDTNDNEIKEFRLKTNKYGSVSGEFKLPSNVLTGEFYIEMDEDMNMDGDDDPYWEKIDDIEYRDVYFSVEEYKRPRFEVVMDPVTESYKFGDSILMSGDAKAFLGSNISGAEVKYTVKRETEHNWYFSSYHNSPDQVIKNGVTTTDDKGNFEVDFIATPDSTLTKAQKPIFNYVVSVDVTDINGETRSAQTSLRLGYHNIEMDLQLNPNMSTSSEEIIKIESKNLNGEIITSTGSLKIYQLQHPDRFLKERFWELPEIQSIPKEEFIALFPNISYDSTEVKVNWPRGSMVLEQELDTSGTSEITLKNLSKWQPGYYVALGTAINKQGDSITIEKEFTLKDANNNTPYQEAAVDYKILNSTFIEDGYVELLFTTPLDTVNLNLSAYYKEKSLLDKNVLLEKGNTKVKIPVRKSFTDKITVKYNYVKYNRFKQQSFDVRFAKAENFLNIETLSFRNHLKPDQPETWSFKITGVDKNTDAEVLASMYDMSLDEFKEHDWNANIGFNNYNYYSTPGTSADNYFNTENFRTFNNNIYGYGTTPYKSYKALYWFGFDFNGNIYTNKRYLRKLARQKALEASEDKSKSVRVGGGTISGTVTGQDGLPLPGVNVVIKGTSRGAQTDFDGNFTLETKKGDVLVFSYIGMVSTEATVVNNTVSVSMMESMEALEEVVTVGYGVQKEAAMSDSEVIGALQGSVAGVEIQKNTAGATQQITIRGSSSVQDGKKPLLIIDGVIQTEINYTANPEDIADTTVLKGEAATSIYGAKGANGVIVITTKKGMEEVMQVDARDNLKETAFFFPHLTTDKDGVISFNFDSPQALTKWKLMLLAHNKELAIGTVEKTAVTQKDLMVIPNPPRFLREHDTIVFSAKITNLTTEAMSGTSVLQLYDAVSMKAVDANFSNVDFNKNFNVTAKGSTNVSWKLVVPQGIQALQYKIVAKSGNFSDGEENILPVLTNRTLVTESKPIWVKPKTEKEVVLNGLKNNNSPTLKNHLFTLEYTSNPVWYAIKSLPYLMEFPYDCAEQTFSKYYSNAIAAHILNSNPKIKEVFDSWKKNNTDKSLLETNEELKSILLQETPWLKDVQSEAEQKQSLAELFDMEKLAEQEMYTLNKLDELQSASGGFPWFAGGRENEFITRHIVAGFGHIKQLNISSEYQYRTNEIVKKAIKYLDSEFINNYNRRKKYIKKEKDIHLNHGVIHYLYLRSFYLKEHPFNEETQKIVDYYLGKSKEDWLTMSLYGKAMMALYLHRMDKKKLSEDIIESLFENAVHSEENGMYWKDNKASWYWYQSPIETHALLIEVFSEIKNDKKITDELKLWLLQNKRTNNWETTKATTEAVYALLMHDSDWLSVTDNTVITIGSEKIKTKKMEAAKKEAGTGYFKLNWKADEITQKMSEVKVVNKSDVTGYGGVYWQYFEDLDKIKTAEESPLSVKKELYLKKSTDSGKQLVHINNTEALKVGDLITVRIEITSENDMEFIHLKDMRAAGLEPIDVLSEYKWQDGLGYYQSTKDVATHFFFDILPKGTYIFEYDLRVNNSGNFSNGISTLQSMYAPEFSGHSKGIRLRVE
ncbi:carboxypeptidase-like regulatory domain-containing protein [Galbibacter sp. EGI 63066]|uniref:alpha-2-macroglobulin family protein n=1 Tax=Galbibacter sp. EGI 63066 TaxID=2993559 RepID=UPI0022495F43|nr:carboxypeptidase-like regulatory domain-containing protein [Galbibacter sp. EGI 63066]MCX2680165.1 carboxypeptidase-like regulatory domain-containing protein [Galbibacter sp. EGI 63066]